MWQILKSTKECSERQNFQAGKMSEDYIKEEKLSMARCSSLSEFYIHFLFSGWFFSRGKLFLGVNVLDY